MTNEDILSIIFYLCGCFYMFFGVATIATSVKSRCNKLFLLLTISLAIWSFSYSLSNSVPTAEASAFWRSFSVLGWGVYNSILLHFILILTKTENRFNKRSMFVILYLPALINIILYGPLGCLLEKQYIMVKTDFGWLNMAPMYAAGIWFYLYYILFSIVSLVLLINWWKKIQPYSSPEKREAKYFIVSIVLIFFIVTAINVLPDILGKKFFPRSTVIFLLIPTMTLFLVLKKSGHIRIRKKSLFLETSKDRTEDRLRLFEMVSTLFILGGAVAFLIGYFGINRPLEFEIIQAASFFLIAVIVRFVPIITKKQAVQNTIMLTLSTLGLLFLMVKEAEIGALTVWAIYILFLLFNVILDSRINAYVFAAITILVQVVLWRVFPKISVIIDGNEYLTRIFIIVLSFIAVRHVTKEYTSKIQRYQRFAREQEVLEEISSNFISVNVENVVVKVEELFEKAAEILEYSYAFLFEFGKDCEEATILNVYMRDVKRESFPYQPGMTFDTADLPLFKSMVDSKTSIVCEDTTDISNEEIGSQRDYFMARGIKSFFAIPIINDDEVIGIFVVEYRDWIDKSFTESRLNSLKIIANILGDAKRKTLYEDKLYNYAFFDEATNLANVNMLKKRLKQIIDDREESEKIAIINVELANLRMIRDSFGYSIEEQVIIESATILEHLLEKHCVISRTGEGEFVIVLPGVRNNEQIEEFANRVFASFSHPILTKTGIEELFVVIHMGVSVCPDDGGNVETLLKNADLARYEANNTNEKIFFYIERLENQIIADTLLTNRLFKALENEEFFLEFQPQISCSTGKSVGVEALLRWKNGDERVSPIRFVPILEQTGLIYDVGLWVLEQALDEHNRLIAKGFKPLRVSVNLSVVQLQMEDLIRDFRKIIEESRVNPKYIDLEITESWLAKDSENVIEKLHKLKELGVNIAIDDFGKGYSSLNRLNLVPFDRIKIDKDIIVGGTDSEMNKTPIMELIILLARAFRASITAEGVETKEQVDFLGSLDCDEIQGFYFSRPLSAEALEEFLKEESYRCSLAT